MIRAISFTIGFIICTANMSFAQDTNGPRIIYSENVQQLCNSVSVDHKPDNDVNYVPGVDVNGKAVVPADLGSNLLSNTFPIVIPIELNIFEKFNIDIGENLDADPRVAYVEVQKNGDVRYNGQDITNNIQAYCFQQYDGIVENTAQTISTPKPNRKPAPPKKNEPKPNMTAVPPTAVEKLLLDGEVIQGEHH